MRVLVTGSRGLVGAQVVSDLEAAGHAAVEFDLAGGQNIRDAASLARATRGCDAVVHSAALLGRQDETASRIMETNLQGTWNVLSAARETRVRRVVFLSSVDALGVFKGERPPDYLPLDDSHPCRPTTPYGISKLLAEEMCRLVSDSSDVSVICLRPPGVWTGETYERILAARAERASFEWDPFWEYGAFIDVRDLSSACLRALVCPVDRFACLLVCSPDITTSGRTSRQLSELVMPDVPWRGGPEYGKDPYRSLVGIENARHTLGWAPVHTWRSFLSRRRFSEPG